MRAPRLVVSLLVAALAVPSTAAAQRDGFLAAWVDFYQTMRGAYGDEGPQLAAQLEKMTTALGRGTVRSATRKASCSRA